MMPSRLIGVIPFAVLTLFLVPAMGYRGEVGVVTVNQSGANQWHSILTHYTYDNPVVIMGPPTDQDPEPVTVRVRNVTGNGFEFQLDRWDYLPAAHGRETLSYLVVEAGSYTLANGAHFEAGIRNAVATSDFPFPNQSLTAGFPESPAVFAQVVTVNNSGATAVQIHEILNDRFSLRLLVEESKKNNGHPGETVAWVAIQSSHLGGTNPVDPDPAPGMPGPS